MFCPSCSKLASMPAHKTCVKCQGIIANNISCICDQCSNDQKVCSVCLKKIDVTHSGQNKLRFGTGCKACGAR